VSKICSRCRHGSAQSPPVMSSSQTRRPPTARSRSVGSSLSSAIGGTVLTSSVIVLGAFTLPSLTAYRILFAICAAAAVLGAAIALIVPKSQAPGSQAA
jgi:hypothetical protein